MACILNEYKRGGCATCSPQCAHKIAIAGRQKAARLPSDYAGLTLANTPVKASQPKAYGILNDYTATFERMFDADAERIKSLYLYSNEPGTGKTTSASTALNAWITQSYLGAIKRGLPPVTEPAYFLDVNEMQTDYNLATMTRDEAGLKRTAALVKRCSSVPFLVMDDIGLRGSTDSFKSLVHTIINHRTVNAMPTVYTSNVTIEELAQVFDKRLADRVRDQCAVVAFGGESKRGRRKS